MYSALPGGELLAPRWFDVKDEEGWEWERTSLQLDRVLSQNPGS